MRTHLSEYLLVGESCASTLIHADRNVAILQLSYMAKNKKNLSRKSYKHRRTILGKRSFKLKLKKGTLQSIAALLSLAMAGVIAVSFTEQTPYLLKINRLLSQYLGWTAIFLPFLIFIIGLILANYSLPLTKPNVLVGTILVIISLAGITRAGTIGDEFWQSLSMVVTRPGALLMFVSSLVVGVMVLFNLALDQVVMALTKILIQLRKTVEIIIGKNPQVATTAGKDLREITIKGGQYQEGSKPVAAPQPAGTSAPVREVPSGQQVANEFHVAIESDEMQPTMNLHPPHQIWELPPISLLDEHISGKADRGDLKKNASSIERTLESFNISAKVIEINMGPAVTQYALEVALGTKLSKITGLSSDLALALAARTGQIRIEAPIPGRSLVGIELPNLSPEFVGLRRMLQSEEMQRAKSKLAFGLGLDVAGNPVTFDLPKMPHLLIAGATGSGKSVSINAYISTILFRASPTEVKFILVDPKRVELTRYNGIPHLLTPVIVDPKKVISALKWSTQEMERRYKLFAEVGARNLEAYNEMSGFQALPYMVIVIDELADIIMFAPSEVEDLICRIAQMARATGIHLVIATQRPSVDVLTGLIKANIPARIAFVVSSMTDSRVVLDTPGAEKLLGQGDMLFLPPDQAKPSRIQGTFISDNEIRRLIDFYKSQGVPVEYTEEVTTTPTGKIMTGIGRGEGTPGAEDRDEFFDQAVRLMTTDNASASLLQRKLSIGYARAARILDQMEAAGLVGPADGSKPREVRMGSISEYIARKASEY